MLSSFLRVLLILIAAISLSIFAIFITALGSFGPGSRDFMYQLGESALNYYLINENIFEVAFKLIGAAITLISGVWAIHRTLYYADRNLPHRIKNYLEQLDTRLTTVLPLEVQRISRGTTADRLGEPIAFLGPLNRFLESARLGSSRSAEPTLASTINRLQEQIKTNEGLKTSLQKQLVASS